jgi:hypothetical protein
MDPVRNGLSRAWTALRKEEGEERWLFSAPLGGCRSLAYGRLHSIHGANLDIRTPFLTLVRERSPGKANIAASGARFATFRIAAGGRAQGQLCLCAPSETKQWAKTDNRFRTARQFWESQATLACVPVGANSVWLQSQTKCLRQPEEEIKVGSGATGIAGSVYTAVSPLTSLVTG